MRFRDGATALLIASGCLLGCPPPPILDGASAYGKATAEAVAAAGNEPATMLTVCKQRAYLAYLNDRLAYEKIGSGLGPPYEDFFKQARAVEADPAKNRAAMTYQQYCSALQDAGRPYADAVAVLSRYGRALEALGGRAEVKIGDDVEQIAKSAGSAAGAATGGEVGAAGGAVASALKAFAELLVKERVATDLAAYVVAADPAVQTLLAAMARYDKALGQEVANQRNDLKASINAIEGLYGLAVDAGAPPPPPAPASAAPAAPAARAARPNPEAAALRDELARVKGDLEYERAQRRLTGQLRRDINALKPALFFELALSFEERARGVEAEYAKYEGLLRKWRQAHAQLAAVARTGSRDDLPPLFGTVGDLATRMQELRGIIEGGHRK